MKQVYCFVYFLIFSSVAFSQLVVNEVCPVNGNIILDEDNDRSDWIELYNGGSVPFNLHDYILTDREDEMKFLLPAISIPAGGYLVIFTSGKDKVTSPVHTNFKISPGETIFLFDPNENPVDEFQTGEIHLDHSRGRFPDGSTSFQIFNAPTPGLPNTIGYQEYTSTPEFSMPNNFLSSAQPISISNDDPLAEIHFTLNGSAPDSSAPVYTTPISISDHTVIRCIAYSPGKLASAVQTQTYFVNFNTTLPIVSISTDSSSLWDWNTGILVHGPNSDTLYPYLGSNFWQDWSIPVHVEFFENDKTLAFEQDMSAKVHGGQQNRAQPMKSLRMIAKKKYGKGRVDHQLIKHKSIPSYKKFVLRNGSSDFLKSHFRDDMIHRLLYGKTHNDILGYEPAIVFLNGEYYGLENIREKRGRYYLNENYGTGTDEVDILREENIVLEGDSLAFVDLYQLVINNDISIDSNYNKVKVKLDVLNVADYFITQTFFDNNDWPYNNLEYWRPRTSEGKFRYLLFDLDASLGCFPWSPYSMDMLGKILGPYGNNCMHVQIFKTLLENKKFYEYFINRYCDLMNSLFTTENLKQEIQKCKNTIGSEIPRHFVRWDDWYTTWENNINNFMIPYVENRPEYAIDQLEDTLNPGNQALLELDVFPDEAGKIDLNTITPETYPWKGTYFTGVPINMKAKADAGFKFVGWKIDLDSTTYKWNDSLQVKMKHSGKITAYFSSVDDHQIILYPNPASTTLDMVSYLPVNENVLLTITDATGKLVMNKTFSAEEYIFRHQENISFLTNGLYFVNLTGNDFSFTQKFTVIK